MSSVSDDTPYYPFWLRDVGVAVAIVSYVFTAAILIVSTIGLYRCRHEDVVRSRGLGITLFAMYLLAIPLLYGAVDIVGQPHFPCYLNMIASYVGVVVCSVTIVLRYLRYIMLSALQWFLWKREQHQEATLTTSSADSDTPRSGRRKAYEDEGGVSPRRGGADSDAIVMDQHDGDGDSNNTTSHSPRIHGSTSVLLKEERHCCCTIRRLHFCMRFRTLAAIALLIILPTLGVGVYRAATVEYYQEWPCYLLPLDAAIVFMVFVTLVAFGFVGLVIVMCLNDTMSLKRELIAAAIIAVISILVVTVAESLPIAPPTYRSIYRINAQFVSLGELAVTALTPLLVIHCRKRRKRKSMRRSRVADASAAVLVDTAGVAPQHPRPCRVSKYSSAPTAEHKSDNDSEGSEGSEELRFDDVWHSPRAYPLFVKFLQKDLKVHLASFCSALSKPKLQYVSLKGLKPLVKHLLYVFVTYLSPKTSTNVITGPEFVGCLVHEVAPHIEKLTHALQLLRKGTKKIKKQATQQQVPVFFPMPPILEHSEVKEDEADDHDGADAAQGSNSTPPLSDMSTTHSAPTLPNAVPSALSEHDHGDHRDDSMSFPSPEEEERWVRSLCDRMPMWSLERSIVIMAKLDLPAVILAYRNLRDMVMDDLEATSFQRFLDSNDALLARVKEVLAPAVSPNLEALQVDTALTA